MLPPAPVFHAPSRSWRDGEGGNPRWATGGGFLYNPGMAGDPPTRDERKQAVRDRLAALEGEYTRRLQGEGSISSYQVDGRQIAYMPLKELQAEISRAKESLRAFNSQTGLVRLRRIF